MTIAFRVLGLPIAQGSMRSFIPKGSTRPIVTSASKGLGAWRNQVAAAAEEAMGGTGMSLSPMAVTLEFYLPFPKAAAKKRIRMMKRPDADKLGRSVFDSMTGIVYKDDAQICKLDIIKLYAYERPPGLDVRVMELSLELAEAA